jgi:hypothetical protein
MQAFCQQPYNLPLFLPASAHLRFLFVDVWYSFVSSDSLLLHGVGVLNRSNICRSLAPVSLDLDPELSHGDTEQFE